jgi:hypothetical protein
MLSLDTGHGIVGWKLIAGQAGHSGSVLTGGGMFQIFPTRSSRPEQIIARAIICAAEGPAVFSGQGEVEIESEICPTQAKIGLEWATLYNRVGVVKRHVQRRRF